MAELVPSLRDSSSRRRFLRLEPCVFLDLRPPFSHVSQPRRGASGRQPVRHRRAPAPAFSARLSALRRRLAALPCTVDALPRCTLDARVFRRVTVIAGGFREVDLFFLYERCAHASRTTCAPPPSC
eukprot:571212-Pleurochrysis_carterae.AAC.2